MNMYITSKITPFKKGTNLHSCVPVVQRSLPFQRQAMPVPHLSLRGTVMMGGASVMRFFGQAMMYAFASGAVPAAPEGSRKRSRNGGDVWRFFFGWSKQPREFTNATKILNTKNWWFFVVGFVPWFFFQVLNIYIYIHNLLTFIPRSMWRPDFWVATRHLLHCSHSGAKILLHRVASLLSEGPSEGWRLFPSPFLRPELIYLYKFSKNHCCCFF